MPRQCPTWNYHLERHITDFTCTDWHRLCKTKDPVAIKHLQLSPNSKKASYWNHTSKLILFAKTAAQPKQNKITKRHVDQSVASPAFLEELENDNWGHRVPTETK